ncbi:MAG TPA: murein L,D-transpeptidase, partial [Pseudonocardiaceae bacterium]|nr:murein L,D-transpeptidase [Pseudonocardiaceae bacterium]
MRLIRHAAVLFVALALPLVTGPLAWAATTQAQTPCGNVAEACVDLSANQAWLMNHGTVSYGPVPISHGKPG